MNNSHDKLTELCANKIIHQTPEKKKKKRIFNTGSTGNYLQADAPHIPSTNMVPPIHMGFPNGQTIQ